MSDMTACLNELSYIPLNNEQNEPTQGDIGETSNDPTQAKRNEFEELYVSANEELYPEFFQNVFPTAKGYKLLLSYYAIKKTFKTIGLGYESIHACVNDCFLFRGDANKDVHFCLSSHTAKEITWHATGKCTEPGKMQHPVDGVENIDVAIGLKFNMRAMVLWTINDFPARSSLSGWSGQGYKACPTCNEDTPSVRVLGKIGYVGRIRFLKKPHKWRRHHQGKTRLEKAGHSKSLAARPKQKRKVLEASGYVFFPPDERKKFRQFIKGVKLPDGFGSNFKHKVTNNDTNITGLRSHDCHIMMQGLLPYGLQQYLAPDVAKPLIELCLFFKQICSQTLMVDNMLKSQRKVINILCNLELIYPPTLFDIMIHLVIHLPLEAIFGGPIRPRWMYPFERYMKKLKNYVRNKAKPEGSIAKGYVAEEALTFSSHYFRDVTTKFNHPDRNVDCPLPTCQLQVVKSLCKSIGLRSVIRIDHQELKKVIWYVLHNSPEIETYRAKFKIEFPNKDMKKEFLGWFGKQIRQRHVDNDPGVNESSELFALACGPS
uniref:DUF4218 domain-containing protein n=1 Tax=Tanacetum cinerariifolium TaxID=118510 RepID=A0A699JM04_TANCI|nr:hypothetical protein [Tanacetum cinerariifolium]